MHKETTHLKPFRFSLRRVVSIALQSEVSILAVVLAIIVAATAFITKGQLIAISNVAVVVRQMASRGVSSLGQFFVILSSGIDISVGGVATFAICVGSRLITDQVGLTATAIGVAAILLVGTGIGLANGLLVVRAGIPPLIATLAMWLITSNLALNVLGATGLATGLPPSLAFFGQAKIAGIPVPFIFFVLTSAGAYFVLKHTSFGRSVYAVGGAESSAWLSGININRVRLYVYAISGFLAGLAGLLILGHTMTATGVVVGPLEFDTITAVCIGGAALTGGRGSVFGVILGVIILGVISNANNLMMVSLYAQPIVKGALIIISIVAYSHLKR